MERVYLSERNLRILLSKLERQKLGDVTACTIIKCDNPKDPFRCTVGDIEVVAVQDDKYYVNREAGEMHPVDEERVCQRS